MPATIAVVADDLAGAADTAAGFLRCGLAALVTWADPALDTTLAGQADVLAIDAQTRDLDAVAARARTAEIVTALRIAGVTTLYKKADSTLRGHLGGEVHAALTAWHPGSLAIVALAYPGTGRTTVGGRQRVNGVALERPAIAEMLGLAGVTASHADLAHVRGGGLGEMLARCRDTRIGAIVCDAETDDDLRIIARAGAPFGRHAVWVGSGGLAGSLSLPGSGIRGPGSERSPHRSSETRHAAKAGARLQPDEGPVLIVVGSGSEVAAAQAAHTVAAGAAHLAVPVAGDRSIDAALSRLLEERLRGGVDVVLTMESTPAVSGFPPPLRVSGAELRRNLAEARSAKAGSRTVNAPSEYDRRAAARLGELVRPFAALVGGLVVTGGDTAASVLRGWGTTALRLVDEIEPGVPLSVSLAPRPIPVVTKAGAFGHPATLTLARARLKTGHL